MKNLHNIVKPIPDWAKRFMLAWALERPGVSKKFIYFVATDEVQIASLGNIKGNESIWLIRGWGTHMESVDISQFPPSSMTLQIR